MRNLVYYPYFEVQDINWFKFATLYVESLTMLVPSKGRPYLSDDFEKIIKEGKFINTFDRFHLNRVATGNAAIGVLKQIIEDEALKKELKFDTLQKRENQNYEIFEQKFSSEWKDFIMTNRLGSESLNGIIVSEEIAFIYMYELAKSCSRLGGKSPITDVNKGNAVLKELSGFHRDNLDFDFRKELFTREVIEFKLPSNIDIINVDDLIQLRRDRGFIRKQKALHDSIDIFLKTTSEESKVEYLDHLKDIERDIKSLLPMTVPMVTALVYHFGKDQVPLELPPMIELLSHLIPKAPYNEDNEMKRNADQFLTDINRITM